MEKRKILIADDEKDLCDFLKFRLEAHGYDVTSVYDGLAALQAVKKSEPDLMVLDLMLPKMDGYRVCRLLKYDEKYASIPIIILSAKSQDSDLQQGTKVGADQYVTKPFDADKLLESIKELISKGPS